MPLQRGKNNIYLSCKLELINLIKVYAGQADQNEGFWLATRLLTKDEEFKQLFIDKYGQECYDSTVQHYAKTNIQQRAEREIEEKTKAIREEANTKIDELKNGSSEHRKALMEEKRTLEAKLKSQEGTEEFKVAWARIVEIKQELGLR